ncbi:MAG: putative lipopolysaccharide heptosyltransferase III [Candidatus Thiodiazotropha sp.]
MQRVLIIKLRHHGDVLLTSPLFSLLKGRHPHLEIDALVYRETAPMLALHPAINEIHSIDRAWKELDGRQQLQQELALMRRLKQEHYDLILHLTESWRGAILARYLKPSYAITRRYPSRRSKLWRNSFTHHYSSPAGNRRHTVEAHLDALRHLGIQPSPRERRLLVVAGSDAENSLDEKLSGLATPWVVIHPTSRWLFKCWSESRMAQVIDRLAENGHRIVVTAGPDARELSMVERILAQVPNPVTNLAGRLSLKELVAVISRASLFIGVDSVPMHIASATRTPTVVLFGPSGEIEWGPWQNLARVITSDHPCRPCGQDGCGNGKISDCLTSIDSQRVVDAAESLLNG